MTKRHFHYIIFYKPYGVLSQFTEDLGRQTLAAFGPFPRTVYSAGRLDADSEGLLLLTDDTFALHRLTNPKFNHTRTYLVQVERIPSAVVMRRLRTGVVIQGKTTKPASVKLLDGEPDLPRRTVPVRFRKNVQTAWLEITLREGRNRQVRRMTAAVGHPTLRLVRIRIGSITMEGMRPGESRPLTKTQIYRLMQELKGRA